MMGRCGQHFVVHVCMHRYVNGEEPGTMNGWSQVPWMGGARYHGWVGPGTMDGWGQASSHHLPGSPSQWHSPYSPQSLLCWPGGR